MPHFEMTDLAGRLMKAVDAVFSNRRHRPRSGGGIRI
jgi:hypothetical protein